MKESYDHHAAIYFLLLDKLREQRTSPAASLARWAVIGRHQVTWPPWSPLIGQARRRVSQEEETQHHRRAARQGNEDDDDDDDN